MAPPIEYAWCQFKMTSSKCPYRATKHQVIILTVNIYCPKTLYITQNKHGMLFTGTRIHIVPKLDDGYSGYSRKHRAPQTRLGYFEGDKLLAFVSLSLILAVVCCGFPAFHCFHYHLQGSNFVKKSTCPTDKWICKTTCP